MGECVAMVLAAVIDFNFDAAPERYVRVADAMALNPAPMPGTSPRPAILAEVHRLRRLAGLDRGLAQAGGNRAHIPLLARKAMSDFCIVTNPRHPELSEIEAIFEQAL